MKVQRMWANVETALFVLGIAVALGLALIAGTAVHNGWADDPTWWDCVVRVWHIPRLARHWLGAYAQFLFMAPNLLLSAVAIGLRVGWPKTGERKGLAWTLVIAMDFILFGVNVVLVISSVGDLPAECYG